MYVIVVHTKEEHKFSKTLLSIFLSLVENETIIIMINISYVINGSYVCS